jgi:hypothetical protein
MLFRFIKANYQTFYSTVKNASAALPCSVKNFTSADFDLSPGTISALTGTHRHLNLSQKNYLKFIH